ncbi:MAG: radical SAM protein, partial [bacterium]
VIGGYVAGKEAFASLPNAVWYDSMPDMAKGEGYEYKAGVNLSHFEGSQVIPRLCMSKGCKHKCAFCAVPKNLEETPENLVSQQVEAFAAMDAKLVYLDDKTFGQAKNHAMLPDVYWKIKEKNPEFEGFIIQTTAAQFNRLSDEFLASAHVRYVELGIETYNDAILKELHKPTNETTIDQATARARRLKINLIPNVIIGLPQETAETYARTLAWLEANKDIISHVNAYNLALYEGTEIAESVGVKAEGDVNENVVAKSFHKDPEIVKAFAEAVYRFSVGVLDKPPVSQTGLTTDHEIAARYGVEPGRVELLLRQAEDRYRELKANKDRKGRHEDQPMVPMEIAEVQWTREPGRYWFIKGKTPKVFKQWWDSLSAAQRKATRITVKPIGLHGNWRVTMPGNTATYRVVTGEKAEMAFLSRHRNDIEAILSDITSPGPVTTLAIPTKVPLTRSRQQLLDMGHGIAQQLGMTEEERRSLMVELTGKNSMDEMDDGQREQYVQYVEELLRERGETYEPQPSSFYEMLDTLQTKERPDRIEEAETVKDSLRRLGQDMVRLNWDATRMDRFFRWLDLGQPNGWFTRTFWRSMTRANAAAHDTADSDIRRFDDVMKTLELDGGAMFRKEKINDHLELDRWDQIGIVMRGMNEHGKKWNESLGYNDQDIADIYAFWGGGDSKEAKLAGYLFEWYQNFWPVIKRVGISVGIDEDTLMQEILYSPIMLKGANLEEQADLLSLFSDKTSQPAGTKPEQKFTIQRTGPKKGVKLENNAAVLFFNSVNRFNRFVSMAPTAYTISKMLNNERFTEALDKATYDKGKELTSNWLKHAVRGHGDVSNNDVLKIVRTLQHSATIFALGWNTLSVGRQAAGSLHTMSADPLMQVEWPKAVIEAMSGGYRKMAQEAIDKSYVVRHRMIDEFYKSKHKWTKKLMKSRYGKDVDLDTTSLMLVVAMDRRTVITSWAALYRTGLKKGMSEQDAVTFANDWIGNTQEMSEAIYLPDVMRTGMMGTVYRMLAPFTNAINQEYNLYWHDNLDPIREKGLVKGAPTTAYRFLWNYFIPALVFGIIRRGRLPEDKKEVLVDLGTYWAAPLFLVGDW